MKIQIGKYHVISDNNQFQLVEITSINPETGVESYKRYGYFMSMDELLKKLFKLQVNSPDVNSLSELNNAVNSFIMQVSKGISQC